MVMLAAKLLQSLYMQNTKSQLLKLFIVFGIMLMVGCSSDQAEEITSPQVSLEQKEAMEEEAPPTEGLIYSPQKLGQAVFPQTIILDYGLEPVSVSRNLQIVLVGILHDLKPLALIEVNSKGKVVETGDVIGNYKVMNIGKERVELEHLKTQD